MYSVENKVLNKLYGTGRGWAFSQNDFATLGSRAAIDVALHRLVEKKTIRRVIQGIYDYPEYSQLLEQNLSPDIDQVSRAIARKFGWRIQPSGPTALNIMGFSTQLPSKYQYLSDGPGRNYTVGKTIISYKETGLKEVGFKLHESELLVAALRSLGKTRLTANHLERMREWLPSDLRKKVLKDTTKVTGWIYEAIRQICRETDRV